MELLSRETLFVVSSDGRHFVTWSYITHASAFVVTLLLSVVKSPPCPPLRRALKTASRAYPRYPG